MTGYTTEPSEVERRTNEVAAILCQIEADPKNEYWQARLRNAREKLSEITVRDPRAEEKESEK